MIEKDKGILQEELETYIALIIKEYKNYIDPKRREYLEKADKSKDIQIIDTHTISMFVREEKIYLPSQAYIIFDKMKNSIDYGIERNHKSHEEGIIVQNQKTYFDYIKHCFLKGYTALDFYQDTLLHETMHYCGSHGVDPISEGLTELKARELAEKYNLRLSGCGYSKEVQIVLKLQEIFGKDFMDKLTFCSLTMKEVLIEKEFGEETQNLFRKICEIMFEESKEYREHQLQYNGLEGAYKKAESYDKINYHEVYRLIEEYQKGRKYEKQNHNI